MELLSLLAKKTKQVAISDGCDGRPMGAVNCFYKCRGTKSVYAQVREEWEGIGG
jgi:hypothetical protein